MEQYRPIDPGISPRYAQIATFMRLPFSRKLDEYDVALVGVPYDGGTSYRPGTRFGPREIRSQSAVIRGYSYHSEAELFSRLRIADYGDIDASPFDQRQMYQALEQEIDKIVQANVFPLVVGGDHSISLGVLHSLSRKYGTIGMIHFDAHSDTNTGVYGSDFHNGTPFRWAIEEGLLDPQKIIQIGIRTQLVNPHDLDYARQKGVELLMMDDIYHIGLEGVIERMQRLLPERIYVSLDIDAVDPAYAPGTGTPVPGGFTSYEIIRLVRALKPFQIVGFDLVEVLPSCDPCGITTLLAANLIYEFLSVLHIK